MTSPPALVAMAPRCWRLMLSLMNLTEPSRNPTFTPPEWFDWAPIIVMSSLPGNVAEPLPVAFEKKQAVLFGARRWL